MRATHRYLAATSLGVAAILMLGCDDSSGLPAPMTGAIEITVSTTGADVDIDPDGYTLGIDGGPGQAVGVNAAVIIGPLSMGRHLVLLGGVAPNCSVSGTNPKWVDVISGKETSSLPFAVSCTRQTETQPGPWDY
jgi:hypothetical protein